MYASRSLSTGVVLLLCAACCWAEIQLGHRIEETAAAASQLAGSSVPHDPHGGEHPAARALLSPEDAVHEPGLARSRDVHEPTMDMQAAEEAVQIRSDREAPFDREAFVDRRRHAPADADEMVEPEHAPTARPDAAQHHPGDDEHPGRPPVEHRASDHEDGRISDSHAQATLPREAEEGDGDLGSPMAFFDRRRHTPADADEMDEPEQGPAVRPDAAHHQPGDDEHPGRPSIEHRAEHRDGAYPEAFVDRRQPMPADAAEVDEPEQGPAARPDAAQHQPGDEEHPGRPPIQHHAEDREGEGVSDSHAQATPQREAEAAAAAEGSGDLDTSLDEPPMAMDQMRGDVPADAEHAAVGVAAADQHSSAHDQEAHGEAPHLPQHPDSKSDAPQQATVQDDVDPSGACRKWMTRYCEDVEAGNSQVADCLSQYQAAAESGETDSRNAKLEPLADDCHEEVMQVRIKRSKSLDRLPGLGKACADDISRFCNVTLFAGSSTGSVLACLRDVKAALRPSCQEQVFKLQLDGALDYRADEDLHRACQSDAKTLCANVKHGGGRVQGCLRSQRAKLSPDCDAELFRQEVESADDIRLSVRLFRACLQDKKRLCADVAPGQALAKQCLEENREHLSDACRSEVDHMIERRVKDFRLDTRLKAACKGPIADLCSYLGDVTVLDTFDDAVINCLQDFREEIKEDACRVQVHKYVELAAQDIRFNVPLADACYKDRTDLCADVPPGSARVIRCLQSQRDKLSSVCKATLLNEEVRFSENIDFQYPMKQACTQEIEQFCDVVPHGSARVIRCLQDNKMHRGFSKGCRDEVEYFEHLSAHDYRLNYRLYRRCKDEVASICTDACNPQQGEICGGKVLACLSERQDEIKSSSCRREVSYLRGLGVQDFRADMQLAEACRPDVDALCSTIEPGEGRVHKCLRENFDQLSPECRREELRTEAEEADNIQLNQGLMHTCSGERKLFCSDVQPGSARVFRCLAQHLVDADFGAACRGALMTKLRKREQNWRLDPPLRKECKMDVDSLCQAEDASLGREGAVKKCMIGAADMLTPGCRRELGRSLYMSFFVWQPQGLLTAPCDDDIQRFCLTKMQEATPGGVATCLSEIVDFMARNESSEKRRALKEDSATDPGRAGGRKTQPKQRTADAGLPSSNTTARHMPHLSEQCYQLAALAQLPKAERSLDFASAAYEALQSSLGSVQAATGLQTLQQDAKTGDASVSLTGWMALAGVASLAVLLSVVATWAVRQFVGGVRNSGYNLVSKDVAT